MTIQDILLLRILMAGAAICWLAAEVLGTLSFVMLLFTLLTVQRLVGSITNRNKRSFLLTKETVCKRE